jgi:hypothetical protein
LTANCSTATTTAMPTRITIAASAFEDISAALTPCS